MNNNYCFPHAFDENGYPRIEREMSPEDYTAYRKAMDDIYETLYGTELMDLNEKSINCPVAIDKTQLQLIDQNSKICERILYPISGELVDEWNCETVKTHGIFLIIAYAILNYFGRDVSLKDLTKIAVYGGWHHKNGTWWHYLDVVCQAYGLDVVRELNWLNAYYKSATEKFLTAALLDHEMFPEVTGNSLVLITGIEYGKIEFFHPKKGIELCREDINRFARYTRVLWGISNMEIDTNP